MEVDTDYPFYAAAFCMTMLVNSLGVTAGKLRKAV